MKSILPVLLIGLVLLLLVIGARFAQRAMYKYETQGTDESGNIVDPNSSPNELVEGERMSQAFPDTLLNTKGIRYRILREGTGPKPIAGNKVTAHYAGRLLDGVQFDSSYERGAPIDFTVMKGDVIRGWDLVIRDMRKGEKRLVVIPYRHAYGEDGRPPVIPPRATLVFEIELVDFDESSS